MEVAANAQNWADGGGEEEKDENIDIVEDIAVVQVELFVRNSELHLACEGRNVALVRQLLDEEADITCTVDVYFTTRTVLMSACVANCVEIAALLIERGANIESKDRHGRTALHLAADEDNVEVAEYLLAKGAYIDVPDFEKMTPLRHAAEHGAAKVAEILLLNGADVHAVTRWTLGDLTPLHCAVQGGARFQALYVFPLILDHNVFEKSNLKSTDLSDYIIIVSLLLEYGADPNKLFLGSSVLHFVCTMVPAVPLALKLLQYGAKFGSRDEMECDNPLVQRLMHYQRYRETWLAFSENLKTISSPSPQASNSPLLRLCQISDIIRYVTEYM